MALADGYRESTDSWAEVLRSLRDRGLAAPVLAVGDGALGFWGALRDVFPSTREQRCWVHATTNVLDALPKRLHDDAKEALKAIYGAELAHGRSRGGEALRRRASQRSPRPRRRSPASSTCCSPSSTSPRALDPPAHDQPDRVHLLDGPTPDQGHPWRGITQGRTRHGLQAARRRPGPVAADQRPRARATGPGRRHLHRRQATRKERIDDRHRAATPGPSLPDREISSTTLDNCSVGRAGSDWHIEFTSHESGVPKPSPTDEDLLVFYVSEERPRRLPRAWVKPDSDWLATRIPTGPTLELSFAATPMDT